MEKASFFLSYPNLGVCLESMVLEKQITEQYTGRRVRTLTHSYARTADSWKLKAESWKLRAEMVEGVEMVEMVEGVWFWKAINVKGFIVSQLSQSWYALTRYPKSHIRTAESWELRAESWKLKAWQPPYTNLEASWGLGMGQ